MQNEGLKYDLIAADFAKMRKTFATDQKYVDLFMQNLPSQAHILDVGCGSGIPIASYLLNHGFRVTGIDASSELLKIAKQNCPEMQLLLGDIRDISINDKFDGIIEWWCLFHIPGQDQLKMLSRFANWLKKGGILQFTSGEKEFQESSSEMLNQELHFYSLNKIDYENALKKNGFEILLCENDQDEHLVWMARLNS